MMEEVTYQVEYNAGEPTWYQCGPDYETYNAARRRMASEILDGALFDYRIVKVITSRETVITLEAEG